jgi:hypothetical protein
MAVIKSGATTDEMTIDPTSKAARVTLYDSDGNEVVPSTPTAVAVTPVTVVDNDLVASLDVSLYKFLSFQATGTWVGTITFQASNDGGTWTDVVSQNVGEILTPYSTTITANGLTKIPVVAKFLRIRCTAYTSGSLTGTCFAYKQTNDTGQISSTGSVELSASSAVIGNVGLEAGAEIIGHVSLEASTEVIGHVIVDPNIAATPTALKVISGVGINATVVQASPSNVNFILIVSGAATARFVKFYDQTTTPDPATDTPKYLFPLTAGASPIQAPPKGFIFETGFAYTIMLGASDTSTTPFTVAAEVVMMLEYT